VTFALTAGANGVINGNGAGGSASDDLITVTRPARINTASYITTHTAGTDGIFGTIDDVSTSNVSASIGAAGSFGMPLENAADVDIYHLNDGAAIAPGSRVRLTLRIADVGGNLGVLQPQADRFGNVFGIQIIDNRGAVQFGLFDTTASNGLGDGTLVAAPSRFAAAGASSFPVVGNSIASYGTDSKGDFFIDFAVPARQDDATRAGTFAVYVQGVLRTHYGVEIRNLGTTTAAPVAPLSQNILVDFGGGSANFIEANPYASTVLKAFNAASVGMTGNIRTGPGEFDITPVNEYIRSQVVLLLQAAFDGAGISVTVSQNPADFEGLPSSRVIVTSSDEPAAFFGSGTFGISQQVDLFNANDHDEAVVYVNSLIPLGDTPDPTGVNNFARHLTNAVGRRIGELLGLRVNAPEGNPPDLDLMASDSVTAGLPAGFPDVRRALSPQGDAIASTDFFLGVQNGQSLLHRIFFTP